MKVRERALKYEPVIRSVRTPTATSPTRTCSTLPAGSEVFQASSTVLVAAALCQLRRAIQPAGLQTGPSLRSRRPSLASGTRRLSSEEIERRPSVRGNRKQNRSSRLSVVRYFLSFALKAIKHQGYLW